MVERFEVGQRLEHTDLGRCVVVDVGQGGMVSLIEMTCRKRLDVDADWLRSTCRLVAHAPKTGDVWRWKGFVGPDLSVFRIGTHDSLMAREQWYGAREQLPGEWKTTYGDGSRGVTDIALWFAARGCELADDGFSAEEPASTKPKFDGVKFHHRARPSRVYALVAHRDHYGAEIVVDDGNGGTWVDGYRDDQVEDFFAEGRWVRAQTDAGAEATTCATQAAQMTT